MKLPTDPKKIFLYFIHEREAIRIKKESKHSTPWTKDPILGKYRFCNVNREHDAVTKWIHQRIRIPGRNDPHLWFALIVARLINQPSTLDRIYYCMPSNDPDSFVGCDWNKKRFLQMTDPDTQPKPIFNAAYIVSTNGIAMQKNKYVAERVLDPLWNTRDEVKKMPWDCSVWADWLLNFQGMGDFMVNQIVTDYKYTSLCCGAEDVTSFVMAGPGTRRGLNRYFSRDKSDSINRDRGVRELKEIRRTINMACDPTINRHFKDLNNLSNCFCEFDKYMRALTGEGRPKQGYTP